VSNEAWERHKCILEWRRIGETSFLELGKELYEMRETRGWEKLGHVTFNAYLADPDGVNMKKSAAYAMIGNYKRYKLELNCPTVGLLTAGWGKLDVVRPHVTEENVEEWVRKAGVLSRSSLSLAMEEAGMRPKYPKPDANQLQIVDDCRAVGMYVWDLSKLGGEVLDLMVFWHGEMLPVEIKMPGCENDLTDGERTALRILRERGIPAIVATCAEDVQEAFEEMINANGE